MWGGCPNFGVSNISLFKDCVYGKLVTVLECLSWLLNNRTCNGAEIYLCKSNDLFS